MPSFQKWGLMPRWLGRKVSGKPEGPQEEAGSEARGEQAAEAAGKGGVQPMRVPHVPRGWTLGGRDQGHSCSGNARVM